MSRVASVKPGTSVTHRFRVIPYDVFDVRGRRLRARPIRVSNRSEAASPSLRYVAVRGPRPQTTPTSAGTRATASAPRATATWTFTGREVAWVAAKGRH